MEEERIFQVSEFNEFIDTYLRQVKDVVVEGELSELNVSKGKWVYATIKDEDASVRVFGTVFKLTNAKQLEPGAKVHVYGVPGLYQRSGSFSIQADQIIPVGEGALQAMFDKLKSQLELEGLFAEERKRPITEFPENIGLITAKGSQAYRDFVKVISERMGGITINFYPVSVQGKNSVPSIVRAFEYFNSQKMEIDSIVLIRGGGSLEDLISFNDESVVRAIFSCKFPVICGVGHEGDVSLADLVADIRASTPSNAAELLTREREECIREVKHMVSKMNAAIYTILQEREKQVMHAFNVIDHEIKDKINQTTGLVERFENEIRLIEQKADRLIEQISIMDGSLRTSANYVIKNTHSRIDSQIKYILNQVQNSLSNENDKLTYMTKTIKNMDHRNLLQRGYSITTNGDGRIIKSVSDAKKESDIETVLSDGKIQSVVK